MKKMAVKTIIVLLILTIFILVIGRVEAYSGEIDPENLITMPIFSNGSISVSSKVTNYTLYVQAVKMTAEDYSKFVTQNESAKKEIEDMKSEINSLKTELQQSKEDYQTASTAYSNGQKDTQLSETELETLKENYEQAKKVYEEKVSVYNTKVDECNNIASELENKVKKLIPDYVEANWKQGNKLTHTQEELNSLGDQCAIWAKLVTSDNKIYYDVDIYSVNADKSAEDNNNEVNTDSNIVTDTNSNGNTNISNIPDSKKVLPFAGTQAKLGLLIAAVITIGIGVICYKKYKYLNIK